MEAFRFVASVYKLVAIKPPLYSKTLYHELITVKFSKMGQERKISYNTTKILSMVRFQYICDSL